MDPMELSAALDDTSPFGGNNEVNYLFAPFYNKKPYLHPNKYSPPPNGILKVLLVASAFVRFAKSFYSHMFSI
jgi:hypothetical protein